MRNTIETNMRAILLLSLFLAVRGTMVYEAEKDGIDGQYIVVLEVWFRYYL